MIVKKKISIQDCNSYQRLTVIVKCHLSFTIIIKRYLGFAVIIRYPRFTVIVHEGNKYGHLNSIPCILLLHYLFSEH